MYDANPTWGAPRIHGELLKLGIRVSESTVSRYLPRNRKPPSQGWRTFLANHLGDTIAIDFAVVPTVTFQLLFVFVVLSLERRRVLHLNVTAHPTATWTARQIVEALPWDQNPRFLIRDRDGIYGEVFRKRVETLGLREVIIAARSPWQNAYVERFIGSLRRECLDHVIVLSEKQLRRVGARYARHYNCSRTLCVLNIRPPRDCWVVLLPPPGDPTADDMGATYRPLTDLRDTFASQLLTAEVQIGYISRQLGHADVSVTARHYARWTGGDEYVDPMSRQPGEIPADFLARMGGTGRPKTAQIMRSDVTVRRPLNEITSNEAGLDGDPGAIRTRDPQLRRVASEIAYPFGTADVFGLARP